MGIYQERWKKEGEDETRARTPTPAVLVRPERRSTGVHIVRAAPPITMHPPRAEQGLLLLTHAPSFEGQYIISFESSSE